MEEITKRDYFAIRILQNLMDRSGGSVYNDEATICEAYRLADIMQSKGNVSSEEVVADGWVVTECCPTCGGACPCCGWESQEQHT